MNEEDGKPGSVARKSGHRDALADAPVPSLPRAIPPLQSNLHRSRINPFAGGKEKRHENLPGK